jgi:hypothetical protein
MLPTQAKGLGGNGVSVKIAQAALTQKEKKQEKKSMKENSFMLKDK